MSFPYVAIYKSIIDSQVNFARFSMSSCLLVFVLLRVIKRIPNSFSSTVFDSQ